MLHLTIDLEATDRQGLGCNAGTVGQESEPCDKRFLIKKIIKDYIHLEATVGLPQI
jgi:hypothetical protein